MKTEYNVIVRSIEPDPSTPTSELSITNTAKIFSYDKTIVIENASSEIRIADMQGRLVNTTKATTDRTEIPMQKSGIYIVKTGNTTQKVMIR